MKFKLLLKHDWPFELKLMLSSWSVWFCLFLMKQFISSRNSHMCYNHLDYLRMHQQGFWPNKSHFHEQSSLAYTRMHVCVSILNKCVAHFGCGVGKVQSETIKTSICETPLFIDEKCPVKYSNQYDFCRALLRTSKPINAY